MLQRSLSILCLSASALAAPQGPIELDGRTWPDLESYYRSAEFQRSGRRCGTPPRDPLAAQFEAPGDCTLSSTNPSAAFDPGEVHVIDVVVHVLHRTNGTGNVSDALIQSQIDILNEDFRALPGTNGAPGVDTGIQFRLATSDPQGNPTNGITRSANDSWYFDSGNYWTSLAWDTHRYLNIYTNTAGGALGYVPSLPQGGIVGSSSDRVVCAWDAFGRNSPGGPPYDQGRTVTHEVGHYLGLYHTFDGGCGQASPPGCYSSGDLVCDTERESGPRFGCPGGASSCSSPDPIHNYMDYTDDLCMNRFTLEQSRRMRCTVESWRPSLAQPLIDPPATYCFGKINSAFCGPYLTFAGSPSASDAAPFLVTGNDLVENQFGFLLYSLNGPSSLAFHNGTLCVKAPIERLLPPKSSGSPGTGFCRGELTVNFNKRIQSGADPALSVGRRVHAQMYYRDPGVDSFNDGLTDGIEFVVAP